MLRIGRRYDAAELRVRNSGCSSEHNDDVARLNDHVADVDAFYADVSNVDGTIKQHCTVLINESLVFKPRILDAIQQSCLHTLDGIASRLRDRYV